MYCPQCGKKFWFRNTFCPDCRVGLVQHPPIPPEPIRQDPADEILPAEESIPEGETPQEFVLDESIEEEPHTEPPLTRVLTTSNPALTSLAQSLLEEGGIEYVDQGGMMKGLGVAAGPVEFWVRGDEAERAREILQDLQEASRDESAAGPEDER